VSYDLHAFAPEAGVHPIETFAEIARRPERDTLPKSGGRAWPLVEALISAVPIFNEEPARRWPIELAGESMDVVIYPDHATISIPYARRDSEELRQQLASTIDAVRKVGGWEVWDPQIERVLNEADLDEVVETFEAGAEAARAVEEGLERKEPDNS